MRQRKRYRLLFTRFQGDTLESSQLLDRPLLLAANLHIELYDFDPGQMTGIGDVRRKGNCLVRLETVALDADILIVECRVAQSITKRVKRIPMKIHVRSSMFDVVVVEIWQLRNVAEPG